MTKLLLAVLLVLPACAKTYPQQMGPVRRDIKSGRVERAFGELESTGLHKRYRDRLLYHLEAGLLYHLAGDYRQSNYFLERAEWISDEMYTRSISAEAAALLSSDLVLPYRGEYFDYLFVNYYKMLNYLYLADLEGALVEVRRINHKLSLFDTDSAFFHYMTAILHEASREVSSAFIEYKKAYESYSGWYSEQLGIGPPRQLKKDIWAFLERTAFVRRNEIPRQAQVPFEIPDSYGQVVFLFETGFVPHKTETEVYMAIPQQQREKYRNQLSDVYHLKVALPEYVEPEERVTAITLNYRGGSAQMELAESPGKLALANFEKMQGSIVARAIARAIAKYVGYRQVRGDPDEDESGVRGFLAALTNIFGAATERADTRSWLSLPNNIYFARKYLPPGDYGFSALARTSSGRLITEEFNFTLREGEIKFITKRIN